MKKILLILFAEAFSLNLIGSSTINLNTTTKDLSHYINRGIKSIGSSTIKGIKSIGSSTINLKTNIKGFSYYRNLGIKIIAYPFVQWWNSKRSTKAFLAISTIGSLLFLKHIKNSNAQLKKEADFLSENENMLNQLAQQIKTNIETISTVEEDQQQNLINDTADAINSLKKHKDTLKDHPIILSTNNKIKLMTLINSTQTNILNLNNKLDEIKKKLNIK